MLLQFPMCGALTLLPCIRVTVFPCSRVTLLPFFLFFLSPFLSAQVGKVGINTTTPAATLHVADSSVLFTGPAALPGTPGPPPVSGPGTRMMWYPDKAAFRAGRIIGTQWDADNIGNHSAAFGLNGKASGSASFIGGGENNTVSNSQSFIGGGAFNSCSSMQSFIGGGFGNVALGSQGFVGGGEDNAAIGLGGFVGGGMTNMANGTGSFVGGGQMNNATGEGSFAGGGKGNTTSGFYAHTGGGEGLMSESYGETVFGSFNTDYTPVSASGFNVSDRLFVLGNGANASSRSNAVTVLKNGRMGLGTDTPALLLELRGPNTAAAGAAIGLGANVANQAEAGRIRFLEETVPDNWRGAYMHYNGSTDRFFIGVHTANNNNAANDIPVITIDRATERVGIGTNAPSFRLHVLTDDAGKPTSNTWTIASDGRLKRNVHDYTDGLSALMKLHPVWFTYTGEADLPEDTGVGVIAQELQEIAPYMVGTWTHESGGQKTDYLSVDNGAMTYMLINAVKEQQAIIEELKRTIETLSAEVAEVKARGVR